MRYPVLTSIADAEAALDLLGKTHKPNGNGGINCQCPAHEDTNPSCTISPKQDGAAGLAVICRAGCSWKDVLQALEAAGSGEISEKAKDDALGGEDAAKTKSRRTPNTKTKQADHGPALEVARYDYHLADGTVSFTKVKRVYPESPVPGRKDFYYSKQDGSRVAEHKKNGTTPLYNAPEVLRAITDGDDVWWTEGEKDADTAREKGRTATCAHGGGAQQLRPEYADQLKGISSLTIVADNDSTGEKHAASVMHMADQLGIVSRIVKTPLDVKGADLTDHFEAGLDWNDFVDVTHEFKTAVDPAQKPPAKPVTLAECDDVYRKWMSKAYDLDIVHASLAARAAHELAGEPVWLLIVGGSASGKTEGLAPIAGTPKTLMRSSIASEGALLSGTSSKETTKAATGGLLRELGADGVLIVKDFTTILSMSPDAKNSVLAALREVFDGSWSRSVGTDGGRSLEWSGRVTFLGATTTEYDRHHGVISKMGDRWALIRVDSYVDRAIRGKQALMNTGREQEMRQELAAAVEGVIAGMDPSPKELSDDEQDILFSAADFVTQARTHAARDYKQEPVEANDPESPTRFVKMLQQIVLGAASIGMTRFEAMSLALRIARDSVPPTRRKVLEAVMAKPYSHTVDVVEATQMHRTTVDRMLQELALQGLLTKGQARRHDGTEGGRWTYCLATGIDPKVVTAEVLDDEKMSGEVGDGQTILEDGIGPDATSSFPSVASDISGYFYPESEPDEEYYEPEDFGDDNDYYEGENSDCHPDARPAPPKLVSWIPPCVRPAPGEPNCDCLPCQRSRHMAKAA